MINFYKLDSFTQSYIICALGSSTEEVNGEIRNLDELYKPHELPEETLIRMISDCEEFLRLAKWDRMVPRDETLEQAGYDFWLTRNGHGSGFWDYQGKWTKTQGERLTNIVKHNFKECDLYIGDDNEVYVYGG